MKMIIIWEREENVDQMKGNVNKSWWNTRYFKNVKTKIVNFTDILDNSDVL